MTIWKRTILLALSLTTGILSAQDGSLDHSFNSADVGFGQGDGANISPVSACLVQPDGKILIGGSFTTYNTQPGRGFNRLNSDGTLDAAFLIGTGVVGNVTAIARQPDGKIIIGGSFGSYNGTTRANIARLNADGSLDTGFDPLAGPGSAVHSIALQPDGKILIGGTFSTYNGTARSRIARLNADGSLDTSFNPGTGATGSVGNLGILSVALQPDGKILIAGDFNGYNGTTRNRIARLNADGSLDTAFNPGTGSTNPLRSIALQSDGKIIVGGDFTIFNGTARNRIARLNATGSLDTGFDPGTGVEGASGAVHSVVVRPDGRILIGGWITTYNGVTRMRIASLNTNGGLDTSFDPGSGANQTIRCMTLQADGKILIGGDLIYFGGQACGRLARVHADGTADTGFNQGSGANFRVNACVVQPDGKILLGGEFTGYGGTICDRMTRLNSDGGIDGGFNLGFSSGLYLYGITLQTDGKIILYGLSDSFKGYIDRFNADGSEDPGFDDGFGAQGTNSRIEAVAVQPDGKLIIGGYFTGFDGTALNNVARLHADGTLDPSFVSGSGPNSPVEWVHALPDGKSLIAGGFTSYNGIACGRIVRLDASGGSDATFSAGTGASGSILHAAAQPDGKVIIGGDFTGFNGTPINRVARLNADGSLDMAFNPGTGANDAVRTITLQPDGRIIIAGSFTSVNGVPRNRIARLNADGSLDASFDPGAGSNAWIRSSSIQADGKIIVVGDFTSYNGVGRNRIARINGTARVGIRVMLEGPYSTGQMNDALRNLPSFPLTEPFAAMGYAESGYVPGASIHAGVLSTTGNNAIVDWVIVEMRPAASPSTIAATRAVLLQRDGDIVDLDGVSTVGFAGLAPGNYCVAVKPRTHLPVMLSPSTPVAFGDAPAVVDFTLSGTQVFDNDARKDISGVMVLATGDATFNEELKYVGNGNDRDPILLRVGGSMPSNAVSGYWPEDVNMDGVVKYVGANNDRDPILVNVGGSTPTATRNAQLP
ncbi:MAG: hypothetical protein WAT74_00845 [Flavobacteriales bacterium]